jgi:cystathionine beta-synthase
MFDFSKISEVTVDHNDFSDLAASGSTLFSSEMSEKPDAQAPKGRQSKKRRHFVEITVDTPLSALNRFFEWQSAAIVTEKDSSDSSGSGKGPAMKPVAVVTKVDLLTWMLSKNKVH